MNSHSFPITCSPFLFHDLKRPQSFWKKLCRKTFHRAQTFSFSCTAYPVCGYRITHHYAPLPTAYRHSPADSLHPTTGLAAVFYEKRAKETFPASQSQLRTSAPKSSPFPVLSGPISFCPSTASPHLIMIFFRTAATSSVSRRSFDVSDTNSSVSHFGHFSFSQNPGYRRNS